MWRALIGSGRLSSGCLVLRADTRENPEGKNGVMTPRIVKQIDLGCVMDCENLAPFLKPEAKTTRLISSDFGFGLEIKLIVCLKLWDENINVLIDPRD